MAEPDDAHARADDGELPTSIFRTDVPGEAELEQVLQHRPTDRVGAQRVLANLEARLLGQHHAPPVGSRYLILGQIGVGGLGAVYAAYDPELDRRVALKFLHDQDAGDRARERLVREAQAMARLSHPNVVHVYDVGMVEGNVFIAMELVDGVPLSTWWAAKRRTWREVRDVMLQAARGLVAAHEAGLVHRDFKPQNVLVGADGRIRVVDFGLARRATAVEAALAPAGSSGGEWADDRLTMTGAIVGTPAYMAPEQLLEKDVGPAADQFSFCVALYEGLYRARPFRGDNIFVVRQAILDGRMSPPSATYDTPAWLHRAVVRGLAPHPEDRFASMRALMEAMTRDLRVRRRYGLVLVLGACLVGGGTLGAAMWLRPEPSVEELQRIDGLIATAVTAAEHGDFVYPPIEDPEAPTVYRVVRELEQFDGPAAAVARQRAAEQRTHWAERLVELGDAYWHTEGGAPFAADYYAAALVFDETHPRARERASLTRGELAELIAKAEQAGFSEGELAAAQSLAVLAEPDETRRAARYEALRSGARPPSPTTTARLERLVARGRSVADERPRPEPRPTASVAKAEPAPTIAPPPAPEPVASPPSGDAKALFAEAKAAMKRGDRKAAERGFHRVLQIDRNHAGALSALAHLYFDRGAYSETLRYAVRAVAAAPKDAELRILLGDAHLKVLAYDDARREYEKAQQLGHPAAKGRLGLLRDKLGP